MLQSRYAPMFPRASIPLCGREGMAGSLRWPCPRRAQPEHLSVGQSVGACPGALHVHAAVSGISNEV